MKFSLGALALSTLAMAIGISAEPLRQAEEALPEAAIEEPQLEKRYSGGVATFFYQQGQQGACGNWNSDDAHIVAIQSAFYNGGQWCGRTVAIKNLNNGRMVWATVADECPTCETKFSLDLSVGAFNSIASEDEGEVPISWWFA